MENWLIPSASITQLLALTPSTGPWRKKLADAAIKYSVHCGECPTGDPGLHHYVGQLYYKGMSFPHCSISYPGAKTADRQFALAEPHLLASHKRDSAITLAEMLFEWSEKGGLDPGAYAVRGVLPLVSEYTGCTPVLADEQVSHPATPFNPSCSFVPHSLLIPPVHPFNAILKIRRIPLDTFCVG